MRKQCTTFLLALMAASSWPAASQDYQAMQSAMANAQAQASRAGDDKLTCDQLADELMAITHNAEFRAHLDAAAIDAQKRQEKMNAAKGQMAMQTFRTVLMATMPGAAMPGMASMQASAQAQGMAGMKDTAARMQQAGKMMSLMPMLTRGQRVIELAQAKGCEWANDTGASQ